MREKARHIKIRGQFTAPNASSLVETPIQLLVGHGGRSGLAPCGFALSFDHFVGLNEQRVWNCDPERLRCLQIDIEIKFGRLLHR